MSDLYEPQISTALHERVDGISPDLSSLAAGAVRQGTRIRRRRTATTVAAAFAVVGVIGGTAATAALLADDPADRRSEVPVAGAPEAETPFTFIVPEGWQCTDPVAQEFGCTRGAEEIGVGWKALEPGQRWEWGADTGTEPESRYGIVGTSPDGSYGVWVEVIAADSDPIAVREQFVESVRWNGEDPTGDQQVVGDSPPQGADSPVVVTAPAGWNCGTYADEKFPCTKDDRVFLSVNLRPAAERDLWASDPDKGGAGSGVLVSDAHGEWFVSIQSGEGATRDDQLQLAAALTWADDGSPVF